MAPAILYDLASRSNPPKAWLMHTWKTRLVLNHFDIDYKTEWIDQPDIEPTFKALGIPPLPAEEGMPYNVPALLIENTYTMGERATASALQALRSSTPLRLDDPLSAPVQDAMSRMLNELRIEWMPHMAGKLVTERSAVQFSKRKLGIATEKGLEAAWEGAKMEAEKVNELLGQRDGMFALGEEVSYADFYIVAYLHFASICDKALFERLVELIPAAGPIYTACEKYLAKDY